MALSIEVLAFKICLYGKHLSVHNLTFSLRNSKADRVNLFVWGWGGGQWTTSKLSALIYQREEWKREFPLAPALAALCWVLLCP